MQKHKLPRQLHLCVQLCITYALTYAALELAMHPWLSRYFHREPIFIMGANTSVEQWIALIIALSVFLHWKTFNHDDAIDVYPSWKQSMLGFLLYALSLSLLITAVYPPQFFVQVLSAVQHSSARFGGPVAVDLVKSFALPVLIAAAVMCIPLRTIRKYRILSILMVMTLTIVMWSDVFEAAYHLVATPVLIRIVFRTLTFIFSNVAANPVTGAIVANDFHVVVGPTCSGIDSVLLFSLFFVHCVYAIACDRQIFRKRKLLYAYALGLVILFFLNALRITTLIAVGTVFPVFALTLFHSVLGSLYFFIFFAFYLPKIREWA